MASAHWRISTGINARLSRNGNVFKSWPQLCEEVAHGMRCKTAVLDGEICCLEPDGRTHFTKLLLRREWPYFYAFDLLMPASLALT